MANLFGRRQNPGSLLQSNERSGHVLDHARDSVLVIDQSGVVVDANAAAEAMYGYDRRELVGTDLCRLRSSGSQSSIPSQLSEAMESELLFETEHVRKDGSVFPVEVSSRGVTIGEKQVVVSIVRDISGRREHDAERDELLQDLAEANRRLDALVRIVSGALGSLEYDDLLRHTLALLQRETDADAVWLLESDEDGGMSVKAELGAVRQAMRGQRLERGEGFAGRVAAAGAPVYVSDPAEKSPASRVRAETDFCSMFGVPMYLAGELFGVLELGWLACRPVDEDQSRLVQAAADRVVLAAANARLYARAKRAASMSAALNDVNSLVNSSFDLSRTMDPALEICARALECDAAVLAFAEDAVWRIRFAHGLSPTVASLGAGTSPGPREAMRGSAVDGGVYERLGQGLGMRESLITRVAVRGRNMGALLFGRREDRGGFDETARDYADRFAGAIALAVANADEFETEHRIAERLQEALLTTATSVRGIAFSHLYRSATVRARVGGDFYDVFELAYGRVGVVIGDVSGKGLEAAVLTSLIKDTILAFAHDVASPAAVMARANSALGRAAKLPEFASVFFGVVETRTSTMTYCCAGHPPAAVLTADGDVELLESASPVIGAFENVEFTERATSLSPGDRVFLYTDGVTEARSKTGAFFGDDHLVDILKSHGGATVQELPTAIYDAVMEFTDGRLTDDIALLAFRLA